MNTKIKNKYDQIHTGNEPGKAEFPISNLLPTGKKNAVSTNALLNITGFHTARELQKAITKERMNGAIICSSTTGGYYLPADQEEIREFCNTLEKRAKNTLFILKSAKRKLETIEGQQEFPSRELEGKVID